MATVMMTAPGSGFLVTPLRFGLFMAALSMAAYLAGATHQQDQDRLAQAALQQALDANAAKVARTSDTVLGLTTRLDLDSYYFGALREACLPTRGARHGY